MKRKLSLVLSILLLIAFTACSSGNNEQTTATTTVSETTAAATEAAATEAAATEAVATEAAATEAAATTAAATEAAATTAAATAAVVTTAAATEAVQTDPAAGGEGAFIGYDLPLTNEKITIAMVASKRADIMDFALLPYFEMIQEATGVEIVWEIYDRDNGWPEQRGLMMSANNYPECFYGAAGFVASDMMAYGATGRFLPLNDLIDKYGKNINGILDYRPDVRSYITAPDGNIYHIPIIDESGLILGSTPFVHSEWLAETGLPMPTDAESILNVLRAMKANGHDTPFGFQDLGGNTGFLQFSALFGMNIFEPDEYCVKDGKIVFGPAEVPFRETLKFLNALYSEGLMDVESLTQDRATFQAKARSEPPAYGLYPAWSRQWMLGDTDAPNYDAFELIPPMKNTDGGIMWNYQNSGIGNSGFIITDKCKNPEIAFCWIDYQAEPDLSIQAVGGPFGRNYTLNADGTISPNPAPEGMSGSDFIATGCPGVSGFRIVLTKDADRILPGADAAERQDNFEIYKAADAFNYPLFNVPFYLSEEDSETVDLIQVDLDGYVEETIGKWIINGNIDAEWDGYVKQLYDYGLQTILDLYNDMYL